MNQGKAPVQPEWLHWKALIWLARILWKAAPASLFTHLGSAVLQSLFPALRLLIIKELIDESHQAFDQKTEGFESVMVWVGLLVGLQVVDALLWGIKVHARGRVREKLEWRLEDRMLQRAGTLDLARYEDPVLFDRLKRAQEATTSWAMNAFDYSRLALEGVIALLSFSGLLLGAHISIPFLLLLGVVPMLVTHIRQGKERFRLYHEQTPHQRREEYLVKLLLDREAAQEIRLFRLGEFLKEKWHRLALTLKQERFRLILKQQKAQVLARLPGLVVLFAAVFILLWQAVHVIITLGAFFALMEAARSFQNRLRELLVDLGTVLESMLYVSDLYSFVSTGPKPPARTIALSDQPLSISCEDVCFAYPGFPQVLHDLNFHLRVGEKIALVGENGAGKTTLIKLLLGLYHPTSGRVLINGVDTRQIDAASLRDRCAAVFQDFLQFQLSARENIGFGRIEALEDMERIREAASASGAAPVVEDLPGRYRTILGRYFEGGRELSRGQWQKLALARAYFRRAQFLVFDEPTAALDPRAELEVFQQFRTLAEDKSAVLVSHRMASARIADRILVLKEGLLVESGHHEDLIAIDGEYARMFALQSHWYKEVAGMK